MGWLLIVTATCALVALLQAQAPPAEQVAQERAHAEIEIPKLVEVLTLKRSMTVADVGAGFGAMAVVLAKWLVTGRVLATDINPGFLAVIRDYVKREGLSNVTLIEGASASTNLPTSCCDAILMRNVYQPDRARNVHHKRDRIAQTRWPTIDRIERAYYTVAHVDGQATASSEADVDVCRDTGPAALCRPVLHANSITFSTNTTSTRTSKVCVSDSTSWTNAGPTSFSGWRAPV